MTSPTPEDGTGLRTGGPPGLLWAMRFGADGCGHIVDAVVDLPDLGAFGEGFLWLHFDLGRADLDAAIGQGQLGPQRLAASAFGPDEHQRIAVEGGHVGGVVADLSRVADGTEQDDVTGRLHFVMGPRALVSGRRKPVEGPEATRAAAVDGAHPRDELGRRIKNATVIGLRATLTY